MKLKNLEKFVYSANFHQQITESVIQKFVEFVKNIRHIKSFKFVIDGLSEERTPLSQNPCWKAMSNQ